MPTRMRKIALAAHLSQRRFKFGISSPKGRIRCDVFIFTECKTVRLILTIKMRDPGEGENPDS
jgi:hypothetical protein